MKRSQAQMNALPSRRIPIILLVFGTLYILLTVFEPDWEKGPSLPDVPLTSLSNGTPLLSQETAQGDQYALLVVFGSWCSLCTEQFALLPELKKEGNIRLLGLAWRDTPEDAAAFLADYPDLFDAVGADPTGAYGDALEVSGAPSIFILKKDGSIKGHLRRLLTRPIWEDEFLPVLWPEDAG